MSDPGDQAGLRALHADLIAVSNAQLAHVDRLWEELQTRIEEFRTLLNRPPKSDESRKQLRTGTGDHAGLGEESLLTGQY